MEMPDVMFLTDNGLSQIINGYRSEVRIASSDKINNGGVEYHHSRIVEALRNENEELKAKLDGLLNMIDKQHSAHLELQAKMDKAKDALEQISRMSPFPDHKTNTMTLVACREIASIALGNKSIVHALRKHKAMNSIYPDAPEQR